MLSSSECILSCLNLPCSAQSRAAYDCSMAKKRRAEKQALGVPVNKRKSLLMKPRHYSPDVDCKGNPDNRNEDDGLLETNDHSTAGSKKAWPKLYIFLSPDVILILWNIQLLGLLSIFGFRNQKPNTCFTQYSLIKALHILIRFYLKSDYHSLMMACAHFKSCLGYASLCRK